jgi:hypothetical protein
MRSWLPFLGEAGDEQYRQLYGFKIYAYVLMTNHVHLLIETARVSLSRIMQVYIGALGTEWGRAHESSASGCIAIPLSSAGCTQRMPQLEMRKRKLLCFTNLGNKPILKPDI